MISDYFDTVRNRLRASSIIAETRVDFLEFGEEEGMLRGRILFVNGFYFEFMEYLSENKRMKYRFHFCSNKGEMIFRYDNAAHHPDVNTFPHHEHLGKEIVESKEKGFFEAFEEAERRVLKE